MRKRMIAWLLICASMLALCVSAQAVAKGFTVRYGDRERKRVAITIDDCFSLEHTIAAFELANRYEVPITFFMLGINLPEQDAEVWRAIAESRCEIGNHTYGHISLATLDARGIYAQLMKAQEQLDAKLGYHYPMQVMRPPYGHLNQDGATHVLKAIEDVGYTHAVLWDVSQTDSEQCYRRVKNGSILLFHTQAKDIRCLEELIPRLLEDGYELVTVSEMLDMPPVATSTDMYTYVYYHDWQKQKAP